MTPISCGDMSSEMYLDIEVYLSEYLQFGQVYHGVCLYGTTAGYGAGADTNISICNIYGSKSRLNVTNREEEKSPNPMSQSVTVTQQNGPQMLQIETEESLPVFNLNL